MNNEHSVKDGETLRRRIKLLPEDSVLFRSDFPDAILTGMIDGIEQPNVTSYFVNYHF